jgi:hypothetical protein
MARAFATSQVERCGRGEEGAERGSGRVVKDDAGGMAPP